MVNLQTVKVKSDGDGADTHNSEEHRSKVIIEHPGRDSKAHSFGSLGAIRISILHPVVVHLLFGKSLVGEHQSLVTTVSGINRDLCVVNFIRMIFNRKSSIGLFHSLGVKTGIVVDV